MHRGAPESTKLQVIRWLDRFYNHGQPEKRLAKGLQDFLVRHFGMITAATLAVIRESTTLYAMTPTQAIRSVQISMLVTDSW